MMWFRIDHNTPEQLLRPPLASDEEKEQVFVEWYDHLFWTALFITGSPESAERAVANARELAKDTNPIFRDWLVRWTRHITARTAVDEIRGLISTASIEYVGKTCVHEYHEPLTTDQIDFIRQLPLDVVHAELDALARAVLVLRGVHQNSIANCGRFLSLPRGRVCAAYCRAVEWFNKSVSEAQTKRPIECHL